MGSFQFNVPPSAGTLNEIEAAASASRVIRAGRGIVVKSGLYGTTIELADLPPRLFARVTRITAGSGSGSGSGGSGSGVAGAPPAPAGSGEEAPTEPPAMPDNPGDDVVAGSGSGASGSGSGEACPAGDKPVYSFVEVAPTCGGQWETRENGVTGDGGTINPAYTMNDGTVADGTIVEIVPGALWWNGVRFVQEWVIVSVSGTGTRRRIELVTNVCLVQGTASGSGASGSGRN
jgi:hypothetical protein